MLNIGSLVYKVWQDKIRFGTIRESAADVKGRVHFTVTWHNDPIFAAATNNLQFRAYELSAISPADLADVTTSHIDALFNAQQIIQ